MYFGAGIFQFSSQYFFVKNSLIGIGFYHYIIYILDKDDVGIQFVEVFEQSTMPSRTEEQLVVLISEKFIF